MTQNKSHPILIKDEESNATLKDTTKSGDIPRMYAAYMQGILIPNKDIVNRLKQISKEIHQDYLGEDLHILCTLKGAEKTFSEIISNLNMLNTESKELQGKGIVGITYDFIRASSYTNTLSTGKVNINSEGLENIAHKNILIVEDIIDTGKTIAELIKAINKFDPKSIKVASLLIKEMKNDFHPDYIGFSIPEKFVVGFGLDYNERFRELHHICILNDKGIERYKK